MLCIRQRLQEKNRQILKNKNNSKANKKKEKKREEKKEEK